MAKLRMTVIEEGHKSDRDQTDLIGRRGGGGLDNHVLHKVNTKNQTNHKKA